jgi:hypothetical protein
MIARLGLVVHPLRELDGALKTIRRWSSARGVAVVQVAAAGQDRSVAEPGEAADCDVIVALGGDGTTLAALRTGAAAGVPVMGVACGSLGTLTAVTAQGLVAGAESRLEVELNPGHGGARIEIDGQIQQNVEPYAPRSLAVALRSDHATLVMLGGEEPLLAGLRRRRVIIDSPRVLARDDREAAPDTAC